MNLVKRLMALAKEADELELARPYLKNVSQNGLMHLASHDDECVMNLARI